MSWYELNNRPFLRAVRGLALTYRALGDYQKAVNLLERSLAWNPNDDLGCRLFWRNMSAILKRS